MRFAAAVVLAVLLGCAGEPDPYERSLHLFDRISLLFERYNAALANQDAAVIEIVSGDLRKLTNEDFSGIVEGLQAESPERRADAAFALGFSGDRDAVAPLTAAAGDSHADVRANAVAALGLLGFSDIPLDVFKERLGDPEESVRVAALFGLRAVVTERTEDPALLATIHDQLGDSSSSVRNEALVLLRKLRRKESVPVIVGRALKDDELLVRANAAVTLGAIGRDASDATPELIEALRDRSSKVVESACAALNRIHGKDLDRSYSSWRGWFEEEQKHCYMCPAHPDRTQPMPGRCPECQGKLERALRDYGPGNEPVAGAVYACPVHPEVQTRQPSVCGREGCGKQLVPQARKAAPVKAEPSK